MLLAEAHHQAGLGRDARRDGARAVEQFERARIPPARPRHAIQARHGLGVVIEHVGLARRARSRSALASPWKSGISTSMRQSGSARLMSRMVSAKMPAPPSGRSSRSTEVITAYFRPIVCDRFADAAGSSMSSVARLAVRHRAVGAGARADVAEDHEGRRAVVPALADVGAARVLADGVELQVAHDAACSRR